MAKFVLIPGIPLVKRNSAVWEMDTTFKVLQYVSLWLFPGECGIIMFDVTSRITYKNVPNWHRTRPLCQKSNGMQATLYVFVKASQLSSVATKSTSRIVKSKQKQSLSTVKRIFNTLTFQQKVTTTLKNPFCGWPESWLEIRLWTLLPVLLWLHLKSKLTLSWWMLTPKNWNRLRICLYLVCRFEIYCNILDEDDADL